jgi:hypothetical protein
MELREMVIEDEESNGVYAISLVTTPATGEQYVMLSDQKELVKLAEIDNDEQLMLGLVLAPNQKIYRREGETEYEIYFSSDTVKKASQLYLQKGFQDQVTFEHKEDLGGVTMVESWIVADSQKDKSAVYGKEYPVGSWMAVLKVHSKEMWEEFKESGTITGFSLEGMFTPKKAETELSQVDKLNYLKSMVNKV